ncbi:MAG: polysaccharide deacetylase family protein [Clostridia bacterium]|nr:polysaccharide deacetylase family protein [Clostridia bacterium]
MSIKMLFPNGKPKALTFSYDDGEKNDIRLAELFRKYGLKATFNLNSGLMKEAVSEESSKVALEQIPTVYEGHEVAVHALTHPWLEKLSAQAVVREIYEDKKLLEKYTGYVVRGMAYPFGTYNSDVIRIAKECGIKYSRGVGAHHNFTVPYKWLEMDTTCHQADERLFELADEFVSNNPFSRWTSVNGWLFYVWGHSYEYRTEEDWARMEKFCAQVAFKDDVWYATNIEIYDYIEAYRGLEYSADLSMAYNSSACDVWIKKDDKVVVIPSGKVVNL